VNVSFYRRGIIAGIPFVLGSASGVRGGLTRFGTTAP
jgi:hypothetical protein